MKSAHATSTRSIHRPKSSGPCAETPVYRVAPGDLISASLTLQQTALAAEQRLERVAHLDREFRRQCVAAFAYFATPDRDREMRIVGKARDHMPVQMRHLI